MPARTLSGSNTQNPILRHVIAQTTNCTNHAIHLRNDNNNEKQICGAHQTEVNQMYIAYPFSTYERMGSSANTEIKTEQILQFMHQIRMLTKLGVLPYWVGMRY